MDLANLVLRTSPKFTIWVKYQFHQGFNQIIDPEIPITFAPTLRILLKMEHFAKFSNSLEIMPSSMKAQTTYVFSGIRLI